MKIEFCLFLLFLSGSFASGQFSEAQSADDEVRAVIDQLFDAMRESDGEAVRSLFSEGAVLQTVRDAESGYSLSETPIDAFASSVGSSEPGQLDERLHTVSVHVDGGLATAWMDYTFYYNGSFSHCGVNTMNLIRTGSGWKIFSIADTRRQQDCFD
jgi:ketosteroid isomerase-like protein